MRKIVILAVLLSLLVIPLPAAHAQDEGPAPACTEEELTVTVEALNAYGEGFGELTAEYDLSSDPTDAAYGLSLVAADAFAYEYWSTVYPALPACGESQALAFVIGAVYNEYLTIGLLTNIAAWCEAAGLTDDAAAFAEQAATRLDELNAAMEEMADVPLADLAAALAGEMLPACTEEEFALLAEDAGSALEEVGAEIEALSEDPVMAFAYTEGVAYGFDTEAFPEISTCAENQALGFLLSLSLNEINIIAGLYANAAAEAEAGNTDVAEAMTTSADQRLADFEAAWEALAEMFAVEE